MTIHSQRSGVIVGRTVDICESGFAAMLKTEVAVHEVVKVEFKHAVGFVSVFAIVRHRTAFRYGFEFLEKSPIKPIADICQQLRLADPDGK